MLGISAISGLYIKRSKFLLLYMILIAINLVIICIGGMVSSKLILYLYEYSKSFSIENWIGLGNISKDFIQQTVIYY